MNPEKLEALRKKFGSASAYDVFDPDLKRVAESLMDGELDASGRPTGTACVRAGPQSDCRPRSRR